MASLEKSIEFYRDYTGLEMARGKIRMGESVAAMYGAPGVAMYAANLKLPAGSNLQFLEFASGRRDNPVLDLEDTGAVRVIFTVKDLTAITARLSAARVPFLIPGKAAGQPRLVLAKDPEGFFVELAEADAASAPTAGNAVRMRLGITVQDAEAALRMYREALFCETRLESWRAADRERADVADTVGVEYRRGRAVFPLGNYELELLEFRKTGARRQFPFLAAARRRQPGAVRGSIRF